MLNTPEPINIYSYCTSIGKIAIAEKSASITNVYFVTDPIPQHFNICETSTIKEASIQLNLYLEGKLENFSLPLLPGGTNFMQKVWQSLCKIPYGATANYRDIASDIGNPNATRAVGLANNRNPIPIFIPCHRVIGTNGKLTGYRGGLDIKQKLIDLEAKKESPHVILR